VDQQVVQPERRYRLAERLERQPMVPRSELELFERDAGFERADSPNSTTLRWQLARTRRLTP